jgi:thiol-disulfide isomerase/thioredoxin
MKAFLRLKGKIRPRRKLSAVSYQPSALRLWQFIKYCALDKARYLRTFLQSILVFVSCSAALAQESVVHTAPASQAEITVNKTIDTDITPLKIGDKIPDELWGMYFSVVSAKSDQVQYLSLGDFKDKLIILDFWSTWCGTCIDALPRLHDLQAEFNDKIVVLPITDQSADDIRGFLKKNKALSQLNISSIVEDEIYKSYFPYTMLPHEVWIDNTGGVFAITHASDVTHENISMALEGKETNIRQKEDNLAYDRTLPLLLNSNGAKEDFFLNRSIITPAIQGIPSFITQPVINDKDSTFRVSATNASIISIYSLAFKELRAMPVNRIKLEMKDAASMSEKKFLKDMYCYDWIAPTSSLKYLQQKIQFDLNFFFSVNGRVEQRSTECYVIKKTGKTKNLSGVPEKGFQYLSGWVYNINKNANNTPLLNESEDQSIAIPDIPPSINDVEVLNGLLGPYGLTITEEHRGLDFFVISEL